jgi:hypothetical protein
MSDRATDRFRDAFELLARALCHQHAWPDLVRNTWARSVKGSGGQNDGEVGGWVGAKFHY